MITADGKVINYTITKDTINIGSYFIGRINANQTFECLLPIDFPDTEVTIVNAMIYFSGGYQAREVNIQVKNHTLSLRGTLSENQPLDKSIAIAAEREIILQKKM